MKLETLTAEKDLFNYILNIATRDIDFFKTIRNCSTQDILDGDISDCTKLTYLQLKIKCSRQNIVICKDLNDNIGIFNKDKLDISKLESFIVNVLNLYNRVFAEDKATYDAAHFKFFDSLYQLAHTWYVYVSALYFESTTEYTPLLDQLFLMLKKHGFSQFISAELNDPNSFNKLFPDNLDLSIISDDIKNLIYPENLNVLIAIRNNKDDNYHSLVNSLKKIKDLTYYDFYFNCIVQNNLVKKLDIQTLFKIFDEKTLSTTVKGNLLKSVSSNFFHPSVDNAAHNVIDFLEYVLSKKKANTFLLEGVNSIMEFVNISTNYPEFHTVILTKIFSRDYITGFSNVLSNSSRNFKKWAANVKDAIYNIHRFSSILSYHIDRNDVINFYTPFDVIRRVNSLTPTDVYELLLDMNSPDLDRSAIKKYTLLFTDPVEILEFKILTSTN